VRTRRAAPGLVIDVAADGRAPARPATATRPAGRLLPVLARARVSEATDPFETMMPSSVVMPSSTNRTRTLEELEEAVVYEGPA